MELRALAERPFDLLAALEARLTGGDERRGGQPRGAEWIGLAFRVGDASYLAPRTDVREVLDPPPVTRVPGARPWLRGVANVRGELLPIVDLGRLLGHPATKRTEATRVIVLNDETLSAGFLVDRVGGFRNFAPEDQRHELVDAGDAAETAEFVLGAFVRDGTAWRVFSLRKLAASPIFRDAGL